MSATGMIAEARKSLGMSGRPNKITREYASRHGDEFLRASWCDMAITYWARHSGNARAVLPGGDRAYTVWHAEDFQRAGRWHGGTTASVNKARPGDIVFFDWGTTNDVGAIDHVGVVEKVLGGGRLQTIEANTSDAVKRRVRDSGVIAGYGRPTYEEDDLPLTNEDLTKIRDVVWNATLPAPPGSSPGRTGMQAKNIMRETYGRAAEIKVLVSQLDPQLADVDEAGVARLVLADLPPETIAAAIPAELAEQVATELGNRINTTG